MRSSSREDYLKSTLMITRTIGMQSGLSCLQIDWSNSWLQLPWLSCCPERTKNLNGQFSTACKKTEERDRSFCPFRESAQSVRQYRVQKFEVSTTPHPWITWRNGYWYYPSVYQSANILHTGFILDAIDWLVNAGFQSIGRNDNPDKRVPGTWLFPDFHEKN